jgi:hypothetical protein
VAGVVACLIGIIKANDLAYPSPRYLKDLFRKTGTPQPSGAPDRIGPLPDLGTAITQMESDYGVELKKVPGAPP